MNRFPPSPASVIFVILAAVGLTQGAQETGRRPPTFFETIDVEIVNVDVVVTDRKGQVVSGLTRDDFEILEDGEPVEIVNFFTAVGASARPEAMAAALPVADNPTPAPPPAPAPQALQLTIFVDQLQITPRRRNRLLATVQKFVSEKLRPGDRVALMSYDGTLRIHHPPSQSAPAILAAAEKLTQISSRGAEAELETRRISSEIGQILAAAGSGRAALVRDAIINTENEIERFALARDLDVRRSAAGLKEAIALLSALPGRKALLYLGGTLSLTSATALYATWKNAVEGVGGRPPERSPFEDLLPQIALEFQEVGDLASTQRVAIYGFGDDEGLRVDPAAEDGGNSRFSGITPTPTLQVLHTVDSLGTLAQITGGRTGAVSLGKLLDQVRADSQAYYSLAYKPTRPADSELHKIRVKTRDPKLRIHYPSRYRVKTAEEQLADRVRSALQLAPIENPLEIALAFEPAILSGEERERYEEHGKDFELVRVVVRLPMENLTFLPDRKDAYTGRLRLFVGARDAQGRLSEVRQRSVPVRVPAADLDQVRAQVGTYGLNLWVRRGRNTLAVGVRDELAQVESLVRLNYTTAERAAEPAPEAPGSSPPR